MNFKRIYAIFLRQMYLIFGGKRIIRLIDIFYWPTIDLLLWGLLTIYLDKIGKAEFSFVSTILGTFIFWYFFTRIQYGFNVSFLEDVWTRNFINLFSSPLTLGEYVMGLIISAVFKTLLAMGFMVLLALLLFSYSIFSFGFLIIPFAFVLSLFGVVLGLITTGIILRFGPSAEFLAWSLPALLLPFTGVFYPLSSLPSLLQPLAGVLPSSHVFEGMRNIVLYGSFNWSRLIISFFLTVVSFVLAYWFLLRSYRYVLRKGLFTRFMTE